MCRAGGRRCPSHSNPTLIAERNARRRETYRNNKTGQRVASTALGGNLADMGYFSHIQNNGIIDPKLLTPDSYTSFGFHNPHSLHKQVDLTEFYKEAQKEMSPIASHQKRALKLFTTNEYQWINNSLYGWLKEGEGLRPQTKPHQPEFAPTLLPKKTHSYAKEERTPELLEEIVTTMDSAFIDAPSEQRITYRGLRGKSRLLQTAGGRNSYIDKNCQIGAELTFDGYQSTTYDPDAAAGFARTDGIIFEIKSSSGLHLTSISDHPPEMEVILPRGAKYVVVGVHKDVDYQTLSTDYETDKVITSRKLVSVVQLVEVRDNYVVGTHTNRTAPPALTPTQLSPVEE